MISGNLSRGIYNKIDSKRRYIQSIVHYIKNSPKINRNLYKIHNLTRRDNIQLDCFKINKFGELLKFEGGGGGGGKIELNLQNSNKLLINENIAQLKNKEETSILVHKIFILLLTTFITTATGVLIKSVLKYFIEIVPNIYNSKGNISYFLVPIQLNYLIMQIFKIKFDLPLIGWRVKPEPGD